MIGTWILGIIVCVDDYLNCLAVGAAVRKITDKERVSREMLAYIINSTGVTVCAIIPFSSWAAFMGGLMEKADMLGGYSVSGAYIHTIPLHALRMAGCHLRAALYSQSDSSLWADEVC